MPTWTYPKAEEKPKFAQLIIPTLDSVRFEKLLQLSYNVDKASLLVGGPGTAKTTAIMQFSGKFSPETVGSKVITFSSLTTPQIFQVTVEGAVEKRQGRTFGPPGGKQMIVFVDDISMPYINEWGDQVGDDVSVTCIVARVRSCTASLFGPFVALRYRQQYHSTSHGFFVVAYFGERYQVVIIQLM